jgi:tetratricopeptide (TPR) repeat protein
LKLKQNYDEAFNLTGHIFYSEGKYTEALVQYIKALEINKRNSENWKYKANISSQLKEYKEAHEAIDEALKLKSSDYEFLNIKWWIFFREESYDEAFKYFDIAINHKSENNLYVRSRAYSYLFLKDLKHAKDLFDELSCSVDNNDKNCLRINNLAKIGINFINWLDKNQYL